jgi:hypothetical protein
MRSCCVAQIGLEVIGSGDPSCLSLYYRLHQVPFCISGSGLLPVASLELPLRAGPAFYPSSGLNDFFEPLFVSWITQSLSSHLSYHDNTPGFHIPQAEKVKFTVRWKHWSGFGWKGLQIRDSQDFWFFQEPDLPSSLRACLRETEELGPHPSSPSLPSPQPDLRDQQPISGLLTCFPTALPLVRQNALCFQVPGAWVLVPS